MENKLQSSSKMPDQIAGLYEEIWHEVARLHSHWKIFTQLYAESDERVKLLDRIAPSFFGLVQEAMFNNLLVSISRLTDKPTTREKENLTFSRLVASIDISQEPQFAETLGNALKEIQKDCEPFRDWRNRRIAHKDLPTALHYHPQPLPRINKEMIDKVLRVMREFLNIFQGHYESVETAFDHFVMRGDGDTLVFYLKQAEEYDRLKKEEMMRRFGIDPNEND